MARTVRALRRAALRQRGKSCTYCGVDLRVGTGSGLDRLDNGKGYTLSNVTPCCDWCNTARSDHLTPQEMKLFIGPAIREVRLRRRKLKGP